MISCFFFSSGISWGGLKSCQKPRTAYQMQTKSAPKRFSFWSAETEREPLWVRKSAGKSLFGFVVLCFFFSLPFCHSSEIPAVVEVRQMPKLQGRWRTLFDQRKYDPKEIASGYPCCSCPSFSSPHMAQERQSRTGSLLQRGETKASLGFLFPAKRTMKQCHSCP